MSDHENADQVMSEHSHTHSVKMARFPDMNPGPVVCVRPDGIVLLANAAARRLFGRKVMDGDCLWNLIPEIDEATRAAAMDGSEPVQKDVQIGEVWLSLTLNSSPDGDEIFVFGTDITRQKAAERDVAERARFPELNPGPVARLEPDGTVLRANPSARKIFGREKLAGASWRELCPALDDATWSRIFEPDASVTHEEEVDGRWYSFALRHAAELNQVFVYGSDVTEMKVAERALAELARFPELNPGPVCRLDPAGKVLLANPAALAVFGAEDLTGRSWIELCPGLNDRVWEQILESGRPVPIEATINRRHYLMTHAPGPEGVFVFVYGSDITQEKETESVLRQSEKMATLGTLTAGMAHELNNPAAAAQRAAEQLEATFDRFHATQSLLRSIELPPHAESLMEGLLARARRREDLNSSLDQLERSDVEGEIEEWLDAEGVEEPWEVAPQLVDLGYDRAAIEQLAERLGDGKAGIVAAWEAQAAQAYRLLEEIRHGSSRLVEIVTAMKAYSYLGQGPVQAVDVNEGLRSTLVILRSKLKKGVQVLQELDPGLPRIEAYGSELNQVWTNLIDNAVDAMQSEGSLTLRTAVRGEQIVVEVEDDGPGIPREIQERIYDAFFTTKPPGKGTGLGLNTTYNIVVDKHGGSIDLDSAPGRTRFTVRLPLAQDRREGERSPDQSGTSIPSSELA